MYVSISKYSLRVLSDADVLLNFHPLEILYYVMNLGFNILTLFLHRFNGQMMVIIVICFLLYYSSCSFSHSLFRLLGDETRQSLKTTDSTRKTIPSILYRL